MHPSRIAELLAPFLGPADAERLTTAVLLDISTYIDILLRWNARINLTAIRDPEDIVPRHFGESFFAARHLLPDPASVSSVSSVVKTVSPVSPVVKRDSSVSSVSPVVKRDSSVSPVSSVVKSAAVAQTVADIGSGAGFPGLPMKLWAPHISLTLIESNHKKATFLREVTRALTLTDVNIQNTRAESLSDTTFDLVTLRAVEHFEATLPTAATLVAPGGRLALLIGSPQIETARASLPHLSWSSPIPVPLSRSRVLAVAHRPH